MRLLLDTHALLWMLGETHRLSDDVRTRLSDRSNELVVSAASAWELGIKYRSGKLPSAGALLESYADTLARIRATELPMTSRHTLLAGRLQWPHKDPFDRVLAAQSILEGISLVTYDRVFLPFPGVQTIW